MMNIEVGKAYRDLEYKDLSSLISELPSRFKAIPPEFPDRQPDCVVGILIETPKNRIQLVEEFTEVIKRGTYMSVIHTDVDWLKDINNLDRKLGNQAIRHSVFAVAEVIDKIFSQDMGLKIRFFRASDGADEAWFYLFGLSKEQLNLSEELKEQITTRPEIPLPRQYKAGRGINFSAGVSHSGEKRYKELLDETKVALENNQLVLPFDFFQQLKDDASSEAEKIKLGKISRMIDKVNKQENLDDFKKVALAEFSGLRLKSELLRYLLEEIEKRVKENG